MKYNDIETRLTRYKNYQIPEIPKIMTSYLVRFPENLPVFLDKTKTIDDLLTFIAKSYDPNEEYQEVQLLYLILKYFGLTFEKEVK